MLFITANMVTCHGCNGLKFQSKQQYPRKARVGASHDCSFTAALRWVFLGVLVSNIMFSELTSSGELQNLPFCFFHQPKLASLQRKRAPPTTPLPLFPCRGAPFLKLPGGAAGQREEAGDITKPWRTTRAEGTDTSMVVVVVVVH